MPLTSNIQINESTITYTLEHVLATLIDDIMIGWVEIGNLGIYTKDVLNYIISKQSVKRWVLGECDYSHQYLYGWQDENLLSALYSVTNSFSEDDYRWIFDTKKYPWTISLKKISSNPIADIRYGKNIKGISKTIDPTQLATRLYCYGYGTGDNKLNIESANNGVAYIDSKNISKYGLITRVWTDERYTNAESLCLAGKALLESLEEPTVSYNIDVSIIRNIADLEAGDMVRVIDDGVDLYTRVMEINKTDISGQPNTGSVILANKDSDIAQSVADLVDKHRIATTYSQGAESLYSDSIYDNADEKNPAELTFIIPSNAVHVNEIMLNAQLNSFRAYSKAINGGGGTSKSTNSGGSVQTTSSSTTTKEITSENGGNTSMTSNNSGGINTTSNSYIMSLENLANTTTNDENGYNHNHGISRGRELITSISPIKDSTGKVIDVNYNTVTWSPSGAHTHGNHSHTFSAPAHSHMIEIPNHTHRIGIPGHTHDISIAPHMHNFSLPNHEHAIEYGIYSGPRANNMSIYIDNVYVGTFDSYVNNINLIEYMRKNSDGEISRGSHTIKIVPNSLTRISCNIQVRLFTNSRGDGQY